MIMTFDSTSLFHLLVNLHLNIGVASFPFLLARGHRVLLFSQMTQMLDILQDYMDYRGDSPWPPHYTSLF